MKRLMLLALPLVFILGMAPQAQAWTEVKMTDENVKQLASLTFAGEYYRTPQTGEIKIYPPPRLSISDDTQTARFRASGGNIRPYDFKTQVGMRDGMLMIMFARAPRLFTVERNGAGKFRIQTKWDRHGRVSGNHYTYTLIFNQQ